MKTMMAVVALAVAIGAVPWSAKAANAVWTYESNIGINGGYRLGNGQTVTVEPLVGIHGRLRFENRREAQYEPLIGIHGGLVSITG